MSELSSASRQHLIAGDLAMYADDLEQMGDILEEEGKHRDRLKVLMIAYYIGLSGVYKEPDIVLSLLDKIKDASMRSSLSRYEFDELYKDTVRSDITPKHIITVDDSLYLLNVAIFDFNPARDMLLLDGIKALKSI